jgi:hypothetical protein
MDIRIASQGLGFEHTGSSPQEKLSLSGEATLREN